MKMLEAHLDFRFGAQRMLHHGAALRPSAGELPDAGASRPEHLKECQQLESERPAHGFPLPLTASHGQNARQCDGHLCSGLCRPIRLGTFCRKHFFPSEDHKIPQCGLHTSGGISVLEWLFCFCFGSPLYSSLWPPRSGF